MVLLAWRLFRHLERDTFQVNVYDSPKNGSFKKQRKALLLKRIFLLRNTSKTF